MANININISMMIYRETSIYEEVLKMKTPPLIISLWLIASMGLLSPLSSAYSHALDENTLDKEIIAYRAKSVPLIDGIRSPGEWDDAKWYSYSWPHEKQNITNDTLNLSIGFKFNRKYLFVCAMINDDEFNPWDLLALVFDADDNVSTVEADHLLLIACNLTYWPESTFAIYHNSIIFPVWSKAVHLEDEPIQTTFDRNNGYTFEGAFKLSRLNITDTLRLNIVYVDGYNEHRNWKQVALVEPGMPEKYPKFRFVGEENQIAEIVVPISLGVMIASVCVYAWKLRRE